MATLKETMLSEADEANVAKSAKDESLDETLIHLQEQIIDLRTSDHILCPKLKLYSSPSQSLPVLCYKEDSLGNLEVQESLIEKEICCCMEASFNFWEETKVVAIHKRATSKYMQVCASPEEVDGIRFAELKTEKSSQSLEDVPRCHFVEEIKFEKINRKCRILKRYRCEKTNTYLCITDDGQIELGAMEKASSFMTVCAKGKAFSVIVDLKTELCLCVRDGVVRMKTAEYQKDSLAEIPDDFKMIFRSLGQCNH